MDGRQYMVVCTQHAMQYRTDEVYIVVESPSNTDEELETEDGWMNLERANSRRPTAPDQAKESIVQSVVR